jgi:hypothetical protein
LLVQAREDRDRVEPDRATVRNRRYFSVEDAPPKRPCANPQKCCHLISCHQSLWQFKGRSFGRTTQRLVFARVFGDASRHIVDGQRHKVDPIRQTEVTALRGIQVLPGDIQESGFALDQQGAAAGE